MGFNKTQLDFDMFLYVIACTFGIFVCLFLGGVFLGIMLDGTSPGMVPINGNATLGIEDRTIVVVDHHR